MADGLRTMKKFNVGDNVEIIKIGNFHPSVQIGDRCKIVSANDTGYTVYFPSKDMSQIVLFNWNCLDFINKEIKRTGFAKFIRRVDSLGT